MSSEMSLSVTNRSARVNVSVMVFGWITVDPPAGTELASSECACTDTAKSSPMAKMRYGNTLNNGFFSIDGIYTIPYGSITP